ncbi:MAG: MFS transporter [Candidatus Heimdallarchaeota archaeon]|nr:MFS transporter [Candidatus Heimdallarchaeota archaeon]
MVNGLTSLNGKKKIFYGMCRLGSSIFMNVITLALFWIYTSHFHLEPFITGVGTAVGKIVIAFSSLLFGYLSDLLPFSKLGRRKIFMWTGSPLLAISFVMLFIPHLFIPTSNQMVVLIWLFLWNSLFNLFYGFLIAPYQSWMPEITEEDERIMVSGIQSTTNLFAMLLGTGFSFVIAGVLELNGGLAGINGWLLVIPIIFFAILEVLFFLPALLAIKEEPVEQKKIKMTREIRLILSNKNYLIWILGQGIFSIGVAAVSSLILDFSSKIIGLQTVPQFAFFGATMFVTVIFCFFLWSKIADTIGKKWSLIISFLYLQLVLPLTLVIGKIPTIPPSYQGYLFAFLAGIGLSAPYLFPYAIIADIADKDAQETDQQRSGLYYGFNMIVLNLFQAMGLLFSGFLKGLPNNLGLLLVGPISAGFFLLAIPIFWFGNFDPFKGQEQITPAKDRQESKESMFVDDEVITVKKEDSGDISTAFGK